MVLDTIVFTLAVMCRLLPAMSGNADITDYNYFDVEDFSVDSFFRSLELQSRLTPTDLEFPFAADLENVPISSVGFLDGTAAKSTNATSELSIADDRDGCSRGLAEATMETSVADDNDDDNATAVDIFFHSLQLRSCLLRADDETVSGLSPGKTDPDSSGAGLFSPSEKTDEKNDHMPSRSNSYADTCHRSQSSVHLREKSLTGLAYLSTSWSCCNVNESEDYHAVKQSASTTTISHSYKAASALISSSRAVAHNSYVSADCSEPAKCCKVPNLSTEEEYCGACTAKDDAIDSSERDVSEGGKISCKVCCIELSSKYSYVRHLLTPLHCRRAEGYCLTNPPLTTNTNTEDIVHLISKQKPLQCRICRFYGDTFSQLLYHLTSTAHCGRAKRKLLRCLPSGFVGTSEDIVEHVKSESHTNLVKQSHRPTVITAYRSHGRHRQIACRRTKDDVVCGYCGVKFPSASSLTIHIRRRHTGQRPFACSVCSKSYCDNSTLRLHYRTAQHRAKCAQLLY